MQQALSGLVAITVKPAALVEALSDGGAPCTVEQVRARFEQFVEKLTQGKEAAKVRLVIETSAPSGGQP